MALPSQRLDYRLTVSDVDRGVDVSRSLVVAQHPSETPEHVTLRVLAWCLLYEERLELGPGLCDGDAADLVARDLTGAITTWVECGSADADKVKKWIADLNSDDFKVRDKASAELEALGSSVAATLRDALKEARSAEAKERLERVLERTSSAIRLDVLKLPDGIPVIGVEKQLERARKELSNKEAYVRGLAASSLARGSVGTDEILHDLEKMLKEEKDEYPLRCAAGVASRLGTEGKPLLPALKELLKSSDKNVANAGQYAIDAIEKAKEVAVDEAEVKKKAQIRKEIREFVAGREKKGR